ncbi:restriction endonuclease subunit S (plasmid) [Escherichia coli]|uniref:restriction endonuclease subunit S n=1 Tax=Escherichia coli TaxID=562 RepID=UPI002ED2671B
MSELSYLEKLLDGVEVEWLPLAKVCRLINGRAYKQEELLSKGKYPVLRVGNFFTNQNWYYSDLELDQDKYCDNGDLLYAWSASFGPRIWHGGKSIYHYHIWKVVPDSDFICKQFLYYLLQWDTKALKDAHSTGSTMMHISKTTIEKRLVPIPCPDTPEKSLAIQSEIVRILDKFTAITAELIAELTAELNMRKKQYNYYRDQLLSFKEGEVKWKTLGEITEINTGQKPSEILDKAATFDYINAGTSRSGYTTMSNCDGDTVTTPSRGQGGIGFVGYQKTPFWLGPLCYKIKSLNNEILINKFLFYTLQSRNRILLSLKKEGGVPAVNKIDLAKLIIPLPSLDEQKRIVSLLDKFDTLTNSITEGLPREIELRQKQYEYYRDLLFSFPKPETVSN